MIACLHGADTSWQSRAIERLKNAAFAGHGEARRQVLEAAKTPPLAESLIDRLRANFGDLKPADESDEETQLREVAELHDEEAARFAELLPRPFADALAQMPMHRRLRRIAAIKAKFQAWERSSEAKISYINIIDADAYSLAAIAEATSRKYAGKHPVKDFPEPKHRKRRCEKWWRRQLKKEQMRALKYVEAAAGAVGGPSGPDRPLYVSDYMLDRYRDHKRRTKEILEGLRLVKKLDPTVQIPMIDVDRRSRRAKETKMRLWIDLQIERWTQIHWHVCWITVTLPGQYVPHSTNENKRRTNWNETLGPDEAAEQIQHLHHQTLAILKKKGIRAHGWWNSQPQQSGTPHRHYVLAAPTLAAARMICDEFRGRFSTRQGEQDGEDRGCRAYVIRDDSEEYRPPKGKDGSEETVASVAKYAARYATRYETVDTVEGDESDAEIERFSAWATSRGARKHAWLGLDSQRAPGEIWDTLWKRSAEEHDPSDPRITLALWEMRACREAAEAAVAIRTSDDEDISDEKRAELIEWANKAAAMHAWHAGIAMGLWPDETLDNYELEWLNGEVDQIKTKDLSEPLSPLPPMPLRRERESAYGEVRKEFVGVIGTLAFYGRSDEVIWKTEDEWEILEKEAAERLKKELGKSTVLPSDPSGLAGVSFSPTDPSYGAAPHHTGWTEAADPPPI